ncbi:MAG: mannose-1-phosphate guanyltransferase, partial [Chloroflexi bacterium]
NPRAFEEAVHTAIEAAERGYLVTIGIQPTYPETGYGYIRAGAPLAGLSRLAYQVEEFKEKPDLATATRYVAAGSYQWNASMFVWRARVLLAEIRRLLPDLAAALDEISAAWDTPHRNTVLERIWPRVQDVTIDHGILEHSERVAVVPADMGWSDLGDWHGFGLIAQTSGDSSVAVNCDALIEGASNAVIYGNGRLIAVLGLDNVIVVDTDDAVLVCERTRAQDVRKLVEELRRRGSTHLI